VYFVRRGGEVACRVSFIYEMNACGVNCKPIISEYISGVGYCVIQCDGDIGDTELADVLGAIAIEVFEDGANDVRNGGRYRSIPKINLVAFTWFQIIKDRYVRAGREVACWINFVYAVISCGIN